MAPGSSSKGAAHSVEPVVIYHNPACGTSRKVLETIESRGIRPEIVRYLQVGWTRRSLGRVLDALALKPSDLLRTRTPEGAVLAEKDDETILQAMIADPSLVERPIVTSARGAVLCRPADRVEAVL